MLGSERRESGIERCSPFTHRPAQPLCLTGYMRGKKTGQHSLGFPVTRLGRQQSPLGQSHTTLRHTEQTQIRRCAGQRLLLLVFDMGQHEIRGCSKRRHRIAQAFGGFTKGRMVAALDFVNHVVHLRELGLHHQAVLQRQFAGHKINGLNPVGAFINCGNP